VILADNLQEWDRPAKVRPYLHPGKVSISYDNNEERFHVKFELNDDKISDIKRKLENRISETHEKSYLRSLAL